MYSYDLNYDLCTWGVFSTNAMGALFTLHQQFCDIFYCQPWSAPAMEKLY